MGTHICVRMDMRKEGGVAGTTWMSGKNTGNGSSLSRRGKAVCIRIGRGVSDGVGWVPRRLGVGLAYAGGWKRASGCGGITVARGVLCAWLVHKNGGPANSRRTT